jgi:hypothetical protein
MALGSGLQVVSEREKLRGQKAELPSFFVCPISLELMRDPVTLSTGMTYDRPSIEKWLGFGNKTCPTTNQVLESDEMIPNHTLRRLIQTWCVKNQAYGVERIPTPKAPVESDQVRALLEAVPEREAVTQLWRLAKECEYNRKCIAQAGGVRVLAAAIGFAMDMGITSRALAVVALLAGDASTPSSVLPST